MSKRNKLSDEDRISAVQEYLEGKSDSITIEKKYNINGMTIRELAQRAKVMGMESLRLSPRKKNIRPNQAECSKGLS